jgi:hypothetical protein
MKDLMFLFKMMGLTVVVALLMQIHLGERTAETHFHGWLKNSAMVDWIQTAVDGGFTAVKSGYAIARHTADPFFARFSRKKVDENNERKFLPTLKRHSDKSKEEEMP